MSFLLCWYLMCIFSHIYLLVPKGSQYKLHAWLSGPKTPKWDCTVGCQKCLLEDQPSNDLFVCVLSDEPGNREPGHSLSLFIQETHISLRCMVTCRQTPSLMPDCGWWKSFGIRSALLVPSRWHHSTERFQLYWSFVGRIHCFSPHKVHDWYFQEVSDVHTTVLHTTNIKCSPPFRYISSWTSQIVYWC